MRGTGHVAEFIDGPQDVPDPEREFLAEARQPHLARATLEQAGAQGVFQLPDLHRQRGLGNRAGIGRASEMPVAGKRLEVSKLLEREVYHKAALCVQSENPT